MRETVIQFGEGNFLRAFFDDFLFEMNKKSLYDGKAVIIKPTPRGNLEKFEQQNCKYNLFLRGIENGRFLNNHKLITSVSRCINPYTSFDEYLALAENSDIRFIVSNTTEAGITFDETNQFGDCPALSFPGKLTQLLYKRYTLGMDGFIILPCELIDSNAQKLKSCVLKYAELWELGSEFVNWIESENIFCSTLVDRIVTGYPKNEIDEMLKQTDFDDRLLNTAEPYHFWAIEKDIENELPLKAAGINAVYTKDISYFKKRKVRILNGAHTLMVFPALLCKIETVKECIDDKQLYDFISKCIFKYILDSFENENDFANEVLERFKNPYIEHKLSSIALNSISKFRVRVLPSAVEYCEKHGHFPKEFCVSIAAMIYYYKNEQPNDEKSVAEFIKENNVKSILKNRKFWHYDLSLITDAVENAYSIIENRGIREALIWAMK